MATLNQCNFIGRLGNDVELRYMPNGSAVANISIAVDESYKDKQTGQKVDKTEWVRISAFGRTAEVMGEYLRKGSQIFVTGKMETREYEKDGVKRYATSIKCNSFQMLDNKSDQPAPHPQDSAARQPVQQAPARDDFENHDIPF